MAQLKDLIVNGSSQLIGKTIVTELQTNKIDAPQTAGQTDYGPGANGNVLKSNGSSVYWSSDSVSYSSSAGYAQSALTASHAVHAASAGYAQSALTASHAVHAASATYAASALTASHAVHAASATYAAIASRANLTGVAGRVTYYGDTNGTFASDADFLWDATNNKLTAQYLNGRVMAGALNGLTGLGAYATAEGLNNAASGAQAHVEGTSSVAADNSAHAEGVRTYAGIYCHAEGYTTTANGNTAHAEGWNTLSSGYMTHAEGWGVKASGTASHAEGFSSQALGMAAHAEGSGTTASQYYAHAEGYTTLAAATASHAEGYHTQASGTGAHTEGQDTFAIYDSHAEGKSTTASAWFTHAEGFTTISRGTASHAEGMYGSAVGYASHAEGTSSIAAGYNSHAEGTGTYAGNNAHAEGGITTANGGYSHAEGYSTLASGGFAHSEGRATKAIAYHAHAEGFNTEASQTAAHAEGISTKAIKISSHAEGYATNAGAYAHSEGHTTTAGGNASHSEGWKTIAVAALSHSEGWLTKANATASHAEGYATLSDALYTHAEGTSAVASGEAAHAEGNSTLASGLASHAAGIGTVANHRGQVAFGAYNILDTSAAETTTNGTYLEIVGKGTANDARSNARTLDWSGNEYLAGDLEVNNIYPNTGAAYNIGKVDKRFKEVYISNLVSVGGNAYTSASAAAAGSMILNGIVSLTAAAPGIKLHRSTAAAETGSIVSNAEAAVYISGTAGSKTYNSRTIAPIAMINGLTHIAGSIEGSTYFMSNVAAAGASSGFYTRVSNVDYGRLYPMTVGSTTVTGVGCLQLGNSTSATAEGNARGVIRIYGANNRYTDVFSQANGNRNLYLPNYAGNMYLAHCNNNSAVGSATTPVYVAANGRITACSGLQTGITPTASTSKAYVMGAYSAATSTILYNTSVYTLGTVLYGACWNDYAEYRESNIIEPGRCIKETGNDTLELTTKRLEKGCEIVSDTYGFVIGETEKAKTPIAMTGRVLAYPYESLDEFRQHTGDPVCSGPGGTVSIMTEEEEEKYPSRIIGTISAVPDYETWGEKNVPVNGRVWIRIR